MPGPEERDPLSIRRKEGAVPAFGVLDAPPLTVVVRADPQRLSLLGFACDHQVASVRRQGDLYPFKVRLHCVGGKGNIEALSRYAGGAGWPRAGPEGGCGKHEG